MRPTLPLQRAPFHPRGPRTCHPFAPNPRGAREQQQQHGGPFQQRSNFLAYRSRPTSSPSTSPSSSSSHSFTVDLKVRDSELDQFLVVNNANYSVYLQHARHEFLETIGLPVAAATEEGGALALSRLVLNFKAPLRSGDTARVGVRVTLVKGARVEMEQWVDAVRKREEIEGEGEETGGEAAEGGPAAETTATATTPSTDVVRALDAEATVVALDGRYRPQRLPRAVRRALETGERVPEGTRWFSSRESGSTSGESGSDDLD